MKKKMIKILIAVLIFSGFSYAVYHSKEHEDCENPLHVHVHELNAAGVGNCPWCGQPLEWDYLDSDGPTCTESATAFVWCDNLDAHIAQDNSPYEGYKDGKGVMVVNKADGVRPIIRVRI